MPAAWTAGIRIRLGTRRRDSPAAASQQILLRLTTLKNTDSLAGSTLLLREHISGAHVYPLPLHSTPPYPHLPLRALLSDHPRQARLPPPRARCAAALEPLRFWLFLRGSAPLLPGSTAALRSLLPRGAGTAAAKPRQRMRRLSRRGETGTGSAGFCRTEGKGRAVHGSVGSVGSPCRSLKESFTGQLRSCRGWSSSVSACRVKAGGRTPTQRLWG